MARKDNIQELGVLPFLDSTIQEHNGFGGDAFERMIQKNNAGRQKVTTSSIARLFGVTRSRVQRYIDLYWAEKK